MLGQIETYHVLLMNKAKMREISDWQTWVGVRCQLRDSLHLEVELLSYLLCSLDHAEAKEGALYFIEHRQHLGYCILRITLLKTFTMILIERLQKQKIYWQ